MEQPFATQATKINPYTSSNFTGNLQLSPASDEWKDTNVTSRSVIDGGSKLSLNQATNWNNWEWNWGGKEIDDLRVGDQTNTISKTSGRTTTKTVNKGCIRKYSRRDNRNKSTSSFIVTVYKISYC